MRFFATAIVVAIATVATADVYIYPTFSEPAIAGDFLLVLSPDEARLICVDASGTVRWTKRPKHLMAFNDFGPNAFVIQDEQRVLRVDAVSGAERLIGTMSPDERVMIDDQIGLAYGYAPTPHGFSLRDQKTLALLWRDDRVESVVDADEERVYAVTVVRHEKERGTYTMSDSTLRALDRKTGRQIWSHRLDDSGTPSVRVAVIDRWLAVADDVFQSPKLKLFDRATGELVRVVEGSARGTGGFFHVDASPAGELLVLEAMRDNDAPDLLTTFTVPEMTVVKSIPLPAKENLFFYVDDDVVVTSGIYSAAGFRMSDGSKLWEIKHQLLMRRPHDGVAYASRNENDTAILERIDVATGKETTIYQEPLPTRLTRASLERDAEERMKAAKEAESTKHAEEEKQRLRIGDEVCLRLDGSGVADAREYWMLRRDGTAEYVDADVNFPPVRTLGRWRKNGDTYEIRGTYLVRGIDTGALSAGIGVRANLPLLRDLRDVLEAFLFTHKEASFSQEDVEHLEVRAPGCPLEAQSWCTGDGERIVGVRPAFSIDEKRVTIEALVALLHAMDAYLDDLSDSDLLRFRLRGYRSYWTAEWLDPHSYWHINDAESVQRIIDTLLDLHGDQQPTAFRVAPCREVADEVAKLRPLTIAAPPQ